jgi:hypothetical protein
MHKEAERQSALTGARMWLLEDLELRQRERREAAPVRWHLKLVFEERDAQASKATR